MSPEQAINILDEAIASIQANRQVHFQLQTAISVLREHNPAKEESKGKGEK